MRLLLLPLLLAGCAAPPPVAAVASQAPPAVAVAAAPVAPTAPPAVAAPEGLPGTTDYFGAGLPLASVVARPLAGGAPLATATTDAAGAFRLMLPASTAAGDLLLVSALRGGHVVAAVLEVPADRSLSQAVTPALALRLEAGTTLAVLALAPRVRALAAMPASDARRAALLAAVQAVPGLAIDARAFDAAGAAGFDAGGALTLTAEASRLAAAAIPRDVERALLVRANLLAQAIRDAVAAGAARPAPGLMGALGLGTRNAGSVYGAGGSGGGRAEPPPTAAGSIEVTAGAVVDTTDAPSINGG